MLFFKSISLECEQFLRKFQTSDPLGPYLFSDMQVVVHSLLERFIKSNKMSTTVSDIFSLDLHGKQNLRDLNSVDLGFQTRKILKEVTSNEIEIKRFRLECQTILIKMTEKILEKCPLKYKAVQGLSSLDPRIIFHQPEHGKQRLNLLLESFYTNNREGKTIQCAV